MTRAAQIMSEKAISAKLHCPKSKKLKWGGLGDDEAVTKTSFF